jgi:hypothetical protein
MPVAGPHIHTRTDLLSHAPSSATTNGFLAIGPGHTGRSIHGVCGALLSRACSHGFTLAFDFVGVRPVLCGALMFLSKYS